MTSDRGVCWWLVWLVSLGCGARTSVESVGGRPNDDVPPTGQAGTSPVSVPPGPEPTAPVRVTSVGVGGRRSCAVLSDGGLKCWGSNLFGALGIEDLEARGDAPNEMGDRLPRIKLGRGARVERVVAGIAEHTCAILATGEIKCWGDNDYGQLGLETFIDRGGWPGDMGDELPVVALGPGAAVAQLSLGSNHSCAVLVDGSLRCWGNNGNGQLGLAGVLIKGGNTGEMGAALPAVSLAGVRVLRVAAASVHTCALLEGGTLKCWGWERGFEDEPVTPESPLTTIDLAGLRALDVAAGGGQTCAYLSDQSVRCWAATEHARQAPKLGAPVELGAAVAIEHLTVGGGRGCALFVDASVRCWEILTDGRAARAEVIQFGAGRRPVEISAVGGRGRHHGCALLDEGSVMCWGENGDGQLGVGDVVSRDGTQPNSLVPVDVGLRGG